MLRTCNLKHPEPEKPKESRPNPNFDTTHWSLILAAADRATPRADDALAELCRSYWYPLYAFIRRRGHDPDQAADLTQEFFARLLDKQYLRSVDRSKGRFRAFLLSACKNFLANEHDHAIAQKRGGGRCPVSIDLRDAEGRFRAEPAHDLTPERLFERGWALTVLEQSLELLETEARTGGKSELYVRLKGILTGAEDRASYAQIAKAVGMTEPAVKKAAERLRKRYREILRTRIAQTVGDGDQVDDEIRALFSVLSS
jgi:RNA polymerase sigma factor (sigma-70 family)